MHAMQPACASPLVELIHVEAHGGCHLHCLAAAGLEPLHCCGFAAVIKPDHQDIHLRHPLCKQFASHAASGTPHSCTVLRRLQLGCPSADGSCVLPSCPRFPGGPAAFAADPCLPAAGLGAARRAASSVRSGCAARASQNRVNNLERVWSRLCTSTIDNCHVHMQFGPVSGHKTRGKPVDCAETDSRGRGPRASKHVWRCNRLLKISYKSARPTHRAGLRPCRQARRHECQQQPRQGGGRGVHVAHGAFGLG